MISQAEWEEFIIVWQTSSSRSEVCERLDLTINQVNGRKNRLIAMNVPLKRMKKVNVDVERLIEVARGE